MKGKNLAVLTAAAAIVIIAAYFASRDTSTSSNEGLMGRKLFPDLAVNDVEKISLRSATSSFSTALIGDSWGLPDKFNFPADFQKIRNALMKLQEVKIGQVVDLDDKQKKEMQLLPPPASPTPAPTNKPPETPEYGTELVLSGKGGKVVASLLIGDSRRRKSSREPDSPGYPDGRYVSPDSGKTVYLLSDNLDDFSSDPKSWWNTDIMSLQSSDMDEFTIQHPGAPAVSLVRSPTNKNDWVVRNLAPDEETDTSKAGSVESVLGYLRFSDIADPAWSDEKTGMDKAVVFSARTTKGETYTVQIGKTVGDGKDRYARIRASWAKPEVTSTNTPPSTNDWAKAEAAVKSLQEKTAKWTYVLDYYKTDTMTYRRDDLVRKKQKEQSKTDKKEPAETKDGTKAGK